MQTLARQSRGLTKIRLWANQNLENYEEALENSKYIVTNA